MSEPVYLDTWIATTLGADTSVTAACPGGIHSDVAPPGTSGAFVVFTMQDARDVRAVGTGRVLSDVTYMVKVVGEGASYAALEAGANAIDACLDTAFDGTSAGAIIWCERERPIRYSEVVEGREYRHLGGLYRVQVREE